MTTPRTAAKTIIRAVLRNQGRVFVGVDAKLMAAAKRVVPARTVRWVGAASAASVPRALRG